MNKNLLVFLLTTGILTACKSYKITSEAYTANAALTPGAMIYYLPKTVLEVKVVYGGVVTTTYENGKITKSEPKFKVNSVEITPKQINDRSKSFVVKTDNSKFFLTENSNITFNQFGVIESFKSDMDDKTIEFAEDILKGAASIAKIIAIAGNSSDPMVTSIQAKIKQANADLVVAIAGKKEKTIKEIKFQLAEYYELLKNYYDNNKTVTSETEVSFSYLVDPTIGSHDLKPNTSLSSTIPVVKVSIDKIGTTGSSPVAGSLAGPYNGLLYAIPEVCSVKATAVVLGGDQVLFDKGLPLSQYGALGVLPISSKLFTNKKTEIEFDPSTGTLRSVHVESGASSEKLAKSVANSAEQLKTTVTELKYDQKIESLKKEKELIDLRASISPKTASSADSLQGRLDILKLELEIEKLRKEIEKAKKAD